MADIANLVEELSKLTVLEAADLVKQLETKWGVTAAAPVAVAAAGAGVITAAARGRLDAGEPVAALHLTDIVLAVDPDDAEARTIAAAATSTLLDGSSNFWERAWLNRSLERLEGR